MPSLRLGYVGILVAGMILTGATNSLFTKYQDMQCVKDCDTDHPVVFEQPVWQTLQMFLGEMLCFLPILYKAWQTKESSNGVRLPDDDEAEDTHHPTLNNKLVPLTGSRILLLWIPAFCDLTGTTLMNIGLLYTPVSIYQMMRGSLVLFVGFFSVTFLRRRLWAYQWAALITVMLGVSIVGLSGSMIKDASHAPIDGIPDEHGQGPTPGESLVAVSRVLIRALKREESEDIPAAASVVVGVFFIVFAQIFTATQFVVEENLLSKYSVDPLTAVGYEGLFGTISILLLLPILAFTPLRNLSTFFDLREGWNQIISTPSVLWTSIAIAISIALFNGFGLSVTRHLSATARSVIDSCRTLLIWIVSVFIGWELLLFPTSLLQLAGFAILVYGTFLFNNLIEPPSFLAPPDSLTQSVVIDAPTAPTAAHVEEARVEGEERRNLLSGDNE